MSRVLSQALNVVLDGQDLTTEQASEVLVELANPECPESLAGAMLAGMRAKGETAGEIRGLAQAMRQLAKSPGLIDGPDYTDIVGTGGDGSGSLNISTGVALLAAACGVPIVKHGNRAVSSASGSADVLERLGLQLPLDEQSAARALGLTGFTFLFAPYYHPAMKSLAAVRRSMGVRTVFNILGPLTNPAQPPYSLIGAYSPEMAELMADALAGMEIKRAFVIHGEPGWDEATPVGRFLLFDVREGQVTREQRDPQEWGFARCSAESLAGGDAAVNAACLRAVLEGNDKGPHHDALVLGAALVLELTGRFNSPPEAVAAAETAIDDGSAARLLERLADCGRQEGQ
ncbi:MAG: anthranilate phosphoribosyltransferase [Gammaproteobacteria bacterium]